MNAGNSMCLIRYDCFWSMLTKIFSIENPWKDVCFSESLKVVIHSVYTGYYFSVGKLDHICFLLMGLNMQLRLIKWLNASSVTAINLWFEWHA